MEVVPSRSTRAAAYRTVLRTSAGVVASAQWTNNTLGDPLWRSATVGVSDNPELLQARAVYQMGLNTDSGDDVLSPLSSYFAFIPLDVAAPGQRFRTEAEGPGVVRIGE